MAVRKSKESVHSVVCFLSSTLIQSEDGEIAIENLNQGDLVLTASGQYEPVQWVGHFSKKIDLNQVDGIHSAYPVRICKDAFAKDQPKRDLYVSQLHSLWVDGVLVPAIDLVNDLTITIEARAEVTYYHLELPTHNVIYANGMTAESYLDDNNRAIFVTDTGPVSDVTVFDPEMPELSSAEIWEQKGYAKVVRSGPQLDQIRARLLARAKTLAKALVLADSHADSSAMKAA